MGLWLAIEASAYLPASPISLSGAAPVVLSWGGLTKSPVRFSKDVRQWTGCAKSEVDPAHTHGQLHGDLEEVKANLSDAGSGQPGAHEGVGAQVTGQQVGKGGVLQVIGKGDLFELFGFRFCLEFFVVFLSEVLLEEGLVGGREELLEDGISQDLKIVRQIKRGK